MSIIRQLVALTADWGLGPAGLSASAASAHAGRVSKMRSALLFVLFTIITQGERIRCDDFRPTPIPLDEWHPKVGGEVLHEGIQTDFTPSAALVSVHYWEDALRHSVYLTLVRDKIDQLIAKDGISSSKTSSESKEIDDHDLWNKIKIAPFIRLAEEELADIEDVTVMAKGRLLENKQGFSFVEDERSKENCSDDKCLQGVKAFWSVKRVRQRDHETSQGKYHYELTFSVISQTPKKQKKPHENPIRTFTVRESYPKSIIDKPQEYRKFESPKIQTRRPERALWFHKNIAPVPAHKQIGRRQFLQGFDKIFTNLFSGDDARDYDTPQIKYKQGPIGFPLSHQYSKINHLGVPSDQHQIPYPYRLNQNKQIRPPLSVSPMNPLQQTYLDIGQIPTANSNLYSLYPYAVRDPNNGMKTTRPAVLPTPLPPLIPQRDHSAEVTPPISIENLDNITILPDTMKYQLPFYNKYKPIPVKVNYFPENVRPPVYSAPPGVFVTMDKKPFKPLPPMKYLHLSKPNRPNRPIDFRPSPQVMDVLFADPDSFSDTAFKPITAGYDDTETTNKTESTDSRKKSENKTRKTTLNGKKPLKKHENVKSVSTAVPEIITAQSLAADEIETLDWANILGAFTKTTPMVSQTEQVLISEATTPVTTTVTTAIPKKRITTTTEAVRETTTTTTAPKKRTRPPQKLIKQEKVKKHKRITTTTSTTTTTTTNAPENIKKRPTHDLTPQASSAATGTMKPFRESQNKTSSNPTTTTSTTTTTTTTPAPTTTTTKKDISSTTKPKNKNRFRQSTLMLKGTSVKHDRWNSSQKAQFNATLTPTSSSYRRKGSNFQGYMFTTTPRMSDEGRAIHHEDQKPTSASTEASIAKISETTAPTQSLYDETVDQYETNSILPLGNSHDNGDTIYDDDTNEFKGNSEYTFQTSSSEEHQKIEKSPPLIQLSTTPIAQPKNKTKCKKKKQNIVTTVEPNDLDYKSDTLTEPITLIPSTARTAAEISTGNDILDELLNFNFNTDEKLNNTSKETTEDDNSKGDEFEDFLGALEGITKKPVDENQYDEDDDEENENSDDESEENYEGGNMLTIDDSTAFGDDEGESEDDEKESSRDSNDDEPPHDRPFSFLELMAMS